MKIIILKYKCYKGCDVKVQSHNFRKGKWKKNKNFSFHMSIAKQDSKYTFGVAPLIYKNIQIREVKT